MQLNINLRDREEVAAAHALLAAVIGGALTIPSPVAAEIARSVIPVADNPALGAQVAAEVFGDTAAAAIFGGAAAQTPPALATLAPSTAGAGQSPTALAALPGISPLGMQPASLVPAATIAPEVHAQQHAQIAAAATGTALAPAGNVTLDKNGLPWDGRIHAGTKTTNKDGSWKALRGVDPATVAAVEAQLRASLAQGGAAPQPVALAAAPLGALPAASSPAPVTAQASTALPDPTNFGELIRRTVPVAQAGHIPGDALQQACVMLGLGGVTDLQQAPQHVAAVWATLRATYPGKL